MISLAIGILWFAIGVIVLGAIIWLALYAIKMFVPVPAIVEKVVWVVFLILVLIYLLTLLQGGGTHPFRWSLGLPGPAYSASATQHLPGLLSHARQV